MEEESTRRRQEGQWMLESNQHAAGSKEKGRSARTMRQVEEKEEAIEGRRATEVPAAVEERA